MNTPAMPASPISPLQDVAPPAKQAGNASSDGSFNQALSREIAGRKAEESRANDTKQASQANQEPAAKAAPADKPAKSEKENASGAEKSDDDKQPAEAGADAANAVSTTPAQMLALMIDAGHASAKAAGADKPVAQGDAMADAKLTGKAALAAETASKIDAKAARADTTDKAAAAGGKDFKADLRDAKAAAVQHGDAKPAGLMSETQTDALLKHAKIQDVPASATVTATAAATLQQAVALQGNQAAQAAGNRLAPQVGTPGWDGALAQKVVWMAAGEHQSATLTLNPPDLGPLQVVLNVSNSMANATFTAAQPEVRQALENAMPKLREMLNDAGIQLGQASVGTGMPNGGDTPRDPSAAHQPRAFDTGSGVEAPLRVTRVQPISSGRGLVDTFV